MQQHSQLKRPRDELHDNNNNNEEEEEENKSSRTMTTTNMVSVSDSKPSSADVTLQLLADKMADFAKERDWDKFHSPRNLLLAMVGEVGELSEIFQWKGEVERGLPGWEDAEKQHLGEELSDVLLYLIRLSDICGIDLGQAALRKMELNAKKYPANICSGGTSKNQTHYNNSDHNKVINGGKESVKDDSACEAIGGV